jgi:hypothetical protein
MLKRETPVPQQTSRSGLLRHPWITAIGDRVVRASAATLLLMTLMGSLIFMAGCRPADSWQIVSASLEVNENPESAIQGTLTIAFDRPMELLEPASTGIDFTHPGLETAVYQVENGERSHEWKVQLVSGFEPFLPRGEKPDGSRTQLAINLELLPISPAIRELGKTRSGNTAITPSPVEPARLVGARWVDSDGSSTVNQEDLLILEWDRLVATGVDRYSPGETFDGPDELIRTPVSGDRLGSAEMPARWIASESALESSLILGSSPVLTIDGVVDPSRYRYEGSSSGIALDATSILPSEKLRTSRGAGVSAPWVVDLEGECDPWQSAPLPPQLPALEGASLTALSGGRFLLAGGRVLGPTRNSRVMAEAWIIDPRGNHIGPIPMIHPRKGHSASILAGADTLPGTEDDIVILVGGWDGTRVRNDAEVLPLKSGEPKFIPLEITGNMTPRFEHDAHVITSADEVVLVGGRLEGELNGIIEVLALDPVTASDSGKISARAFQVGELAYPRHQHASVLFEDAEDPLLFVYGGYGGSLGAPYVKFTAEFCRVLSSPEAFRLRRNTRSLRRLKLNPDSSLPGPRRGLKMVSGLESGLAENMALLVAGTRKEPTPDPFAPNQTTSCRTGFVLHLKDNGRGYLFLEWIPAGRLVQETMHPGIARLPGGRILVVGGRDHGGLAVMEASIFDPVTGELEKVCRSLAHDPWQHLLTQHACSTWGGAFMYGVDTQSMQSRGILFEASR